MTVYTDCTVSIIWRWSAGSVPRRKHLRWESTLWKHARHCQQHQAASAAYHEQGLSGDGSVALSSSLCQWTLPFRGMPFRPGEAYQNARERDLPNPNPIEPWSSAWWITACDKSGTPSVIYLLTVCCERCCLRMRFIILVIIIDASWSRFSDTKALSKSCPSSMREGPAHESSCQIKCRPDSWECTMGWQPLLLTSRVHLQVAWDCNYNHWNCHLHNTFDIWTPATSKQISLKSLNHHSTPPRKISRARTPRSHLAGRGSRELLGFRGFDTEIRHKDSQVDSKRKITHMTSIAVCLVPRNDMHNFPVYWLDLNQQNQQELPVADGCRCHLVLWNICTEEVLDFGPGVRAPRGAKGCRNRTFTGASRPWLGLLSVKRVPWSKHRKDCQRKEAYFLRGRKILKDYEEELRSLWII